MYSLSTAECRLHIREKKLFERFNIEYLAYPGLLSSFLSEENSRLMISLPTEPWLSIKLSESKLDEILRELHFRMKLKCESVMQRRRRLIVDHFCFAKRP